MTTPQDPLFGYDTRSLDDEYADAAKRVRAVAVQISGPDVGGAETVGASLVTQVASTPTVGAGVSRSPTRVAPWRRRGSWPGSPRVWRSSRCASGTSFEQGWCTLKSSGMRWCTTTCLIGSADPMTQLDPDLAKRLTDVETNLTKRWEEGVPHHPRSEELARTIADLDFCFGGDTLALKFGGDGDNGETLMYLLDLYFEAEAKAPTPARPKPRDPRPPPYRTNVERVRELGKLIGFGAVMQAAEVAWREELVTMNLAGGEHSVGPCVSLLVPCPCDGGCDWCGGTLRVTKRVLEAMGTKPEPT